MGGVGGGGYSWLDVGWVGGGGGSIGSDGCDGGVDGRVCCGDVGVGGSNGRVVCGGVSGRGRCFWYVGLVLLMVVEEGRVCDSCVGCTDK